MVGVYPFRVGAYGRSLSILDRGLYRGLSFLGRGLYRVLYEFGRGLYRALP